MVNDVANAPAAAAAGSSGSGDVDLPRAQIKRILQSKLTTGSDAKSLAVSKDAMLAFSESAKVFISYISTTANDIAHESKRQTISAEDVVKAVEELEFAELVAPLKDYMEGYRKWSKERNQKRAEASKANKKRKAEEQAATGKGDGETGPGAQGGAAGDAAEQQEAQQQGEAEEAEGAEEGAQQDAGADEEEGEAMAE